MLHGFVAALLAAIGFRVPYLAPLAPIGLGLLLGLCDRGVVHPVRAIAAFAVAFGLLRLLGVDLPTTVTLGLAVFAAVQIGAIATLWCTLPRLGLARRPRARALGFGGAAMLLDAALTRAAPWFGEAQSLAVPWIDFGPLLGLTRHFGCGFAVLVTAWLAAATAAAVARSPGHRRQIVETAVLLASLAALGRCGIDAPASPLRLLALGGAAGAQSQVSDQELAAGIAEQRGDPSLAAFAVLPELLTVRQSAPGHRDLVLRAIAADQRTAVAWGYRDRARRRNTAELCGPDGVPIASYDKQHLVPGVEGGLYDVGDGGPAVAHIGDTAVAMVICQDDQFADFVRLGPSRGAELLLVPTYDWPGVASEHLQSMRWRALENGIPIVRGAFGGFCAVIDEDGRAVAIADGRGQPLVAAAATLTPRPRRSWWREHGVAPMVALGALLLAIGVGSGRRRADLVQAMPGR